MAKRGRPAVEITLTGNERRQLESWARRHSTAQNLAMRCKIVLACADPEELTGKQIASKVGCNPATVSKWRQRFAEKRLDGLIDEPRPGAARTIGDDVVEQVVIDTLETTPKDATHWSTRSMAERHGISRQTVSEIWRAFGLKPWEIDEFKISPDPQLVEKIRDIVGREQDELLKARDDHEALAVYRKVTGLVNFKKWIDDADLVRDKFTTPENLAMKVATALPGVVSNERQQTTSSVTFNEIHPLQRARHFSGRSELLGDLMHWWGDPSDPARVRNIVGVGGTGKTAVVEKWLQDVRDERQTGCTVVWSFNDDPDTDAFLRAACATFGKRNSTTSSLDLLLRELSDGRPHLLVLDGLESAQHAGGTGLHARGELQEPYVKNLLRSIACGRGAARAVVTSRFPLADLDQWEGHGSRTDALEDLDPSSALSLLRDWGVHGDDDELQELARSAGHHALTLAVLASYVAQVHGGDPAAAPNLRLEDELLDDPKAVRLARVLESYARSLTDEERDLLVRLSVFPTGLSTTVLHHMARTESDTAGALHGLNDDHLSRVARRLESLSLATSFRTAAGELGWSAHPFVREWFGGLLGLPEEEFFEAIRGRFEPSLTERPKLTSDDRATLDLYEQLIDVTRRAGHPDDAFETYMRDLRGIEGLGHRAGEYARGLRILSGFAGLESPESGASDLRPTLQAPYLNEWATFAHSLGELRTAATAIENALAIEDRTAPEADHRSPGAMLRNACSMALDRGEIPEAVRFGRRAVAGDHTNKDLARLATALHRAGHRTEADDIFAELRRARTVYVFELAAAAIDVRRLALARDLIAFANESDSGLIEAQKASLLARFPLARDADDKAAYELTIPEARRQLTVLSDWAMRSGVMIDLVRSASLRAKIALATDDVVGARDEATTGLVHTQECGFRILEIELLCARARAHLALAEPAEAVHDAVTAKHRSADPLCAYPWGVARAGQVLADALDRADRTSEATDERASSDELLQELRTIHIEQAFAPWGSVDSDQIGLE